MYIKITSKYILPVSGAWETFSAHHYCQERKARSPEAPS